MPRIRTRRMSVRPSLSRLLLLTIAMFLVGVLPSVLVPITARASAGTTETGGVVLRNDGGVTPFGGATVDTAGIPTWSGDVARAVTVRGDGSGGWTLDDHGTVYAWGAAAKITSPVTWPTWDIARDLVVTSRDGSGVLDGRQGYLLDGFGGIHPFGGAPALSGYFYEQRDVARGLAIHYSGAGTPDGGWTLLDDGFIRAFGAAPALAASDPSDEVFLKLHLTPAGTGGYTVAKWGIVSAFGAGVAPYWSGYSDDGTADTIRDIQLLRTDNSSPPPEPTSAAAQQLYDATLAPHGGVILDAWGGIHALAGVSVDTSGAPYWSGWNIARSVVVRQDGSGGWTLDGFGGIHAWGSAPAIATPVYWPQWDIARALVVTSTTSGVDDGHQGYVLDGFGGIHPFGGAPTIGAPPYMAQFDVYRGLAIHRDGSGTPDGGWVVDAAGRTYAFGAASALPTLSGPVGRPMYNALHATTYGVYAVQWYGTLSTVALTGPVSPYTGGWTDWGSWNMVRDIDLINPVDPVHQTSPLSAGAASAYAKAFNGRFVMSAPLYRQQHALDCEAAAMQIALAARGTRVSQNWELSYWGSDRRASKRDAAGNIVKWGDPYATFVGNVDASEWNATGYGVYYPPLVSLAKAVGHNAIGKEAWSVPDLFAWVAEGHPAAVEISYNMENASVRHWTAWDGRTVAYMLNDHVVTLVGVDYGAHTVIVNDPYSGTRKTFSWAAFERSFGYLNNMATVIS